MQLLCLSTGESHGVAVTAPCYGCGPWKTERVLHRSPQSRSPASRGLFGVLGWPSFLISFHSHLVGVGPVCEQQLGVFVALLFLAPVLCLHRREKISLPVPWADGCCNLQPVQGTDTVSALDLPPVLGANCKEQAPPLPKEVGKPERPASSPPG